MNIRLVLLISKSRGCFAYRMEIIRLHIYNDSSSLKHKKSQAIHHHPGFFILYQMNLQVPTHSAGAENGSRTSIKS